MTSSCGITFQRGSGLNVVAYADAAYAPRDAWWKYVSGGAVVCVGVPTQLISRTQKISTLITAEAKCVLMAEGCKEAFFHGQGGVSCCLILGVYSFMYMITKIFPSR